MSSLAGADFWAGTVGTATVPAINKQGRNLFMTINSSHAVARFASSNQFRYRGRIADEVADAQIGVGVDPHQAVDGGGQFGHGDWTDSRVSTMVIAGANGRSRRDTATG